MVADTDITDNDHVLPGYFYCSAVAMRHAPVASWWSPAGRASTRSSTSTTLAWTSWLKSSSSGSAAGRLSSKIRSALVVLTSLGVIFFYLLNCSTPTAPTLLPLKATVEKSCMQFSIQRPSLPSAESHPEEKLYRRLDVSTWLRHLNQNGQVEEEYKLRKVPRRTSASLSFWKSWLASFVSHNFQFHSACAPANIPLWLIPTLWVWRFAIYWNDSVAVTLWPSKHESTQTMGGYCTRWAFTFSTATKFLFVLWLQ